MRILKSLAPFLAFAVAAVAIHFLLRTLTAEYCLTQLTMALYYAIVVLGLSLLVGFAGQVSLGHAAFFALGGYSTAILTTHDFSAVRWAAPFKKTGIFVANTDVFGNQVLNATPWAAFFFAMILTFAVAHLIGFPALRLRGHYLAMATLGFGLIVHKIILGSAVAGAADGINAVPEWNLGFGLTLSGKRDLRIQNYYLACVLVLLILWILRNLVQSRVGRALRAIHDRETAANAMGINTAEYKLKVFVTSALLAAAAGVCFTHYTAGIGPSEAGALKSVRYLALAAVGGMANLWGVAVISTGINFCSLRGWFGSLDHAVFGGLLILFISVAPDGPLKPIAIWLRRFRQKPAACVSKTRVPVGPVSS